MDQELKEKILRLVGEAEDQLDNIRGELQVEDLDQAGMAADYAAQYASEAAALIPS